MTKTELIERLATVPQDLAQLAADRAAAEEKARYNLEVQRGNAEREGRAAIEELERKGAEEKARLQKLFDDAVRDARDRAKIRRDVAEQEYSDQAEDILHRLQEEKQNLEAEYEEAKWTAQTVYEGNRKGPKREYERFEEQLDELVLRVNDAQKEAKKYVKSCRCEIDETNLLPPMPSEPQFPDPYKALQDYAAHADARLAEMKSLGAPAMLRSWSYMIGVYLLVLIAAVALGGLAFHTNPPMWAAVGTVGTIIPSILIRWMIGMSGASQLREVYRPLAEIVRYATFAREAAAKRMAVLCEQQRLEHKAQRDREEALLDERYRPRIVEIERRLQIETRKLQSNRDLEVEDAGREETRTLAAAEEKYPPLIAAAEKKLAQDLAVARGKSKDRVEMAELFFHNQWNSLANRWKQGLAEIQRIAKQADAEVNPWFLPWNDERWETWTAPASPPPVMRLGEFKLDLKDVPQAIPEDERLREGIPESLTLPAFNVFPDKSSLLLKAAGPSRDAAIKTLQNVMLRLLTGIPPGKARMLIIDPVGLGQNFAAFMHLADYNEQLVTHRIWTEPQQIEQRLTDITAHIENVIQKYLRNQFATIEEYNEHAGEIAEPYRFVVVANFPTNFTENALKRLMSIAHSGPRCGVYTLVMADTKQALPPGVTLSDLEQGASIRFKEGRPTWAGRDGDKLALTLEQPPSDEFANELLHRVGKLAKDANRVEVPFDFVAPKSNEEFWSRDSRETVNVPIGRAGATKRQAMMLGKGTSQHVLIAGKTGSGKSTLLHTLITNAALFYSPEELELYLIDFKKGVEFKTYATQRLPHARVVAIESEREFGLSVMQRLDAELRTRGERFRDQNVQDVKGYRNATGEPLPRILFIVDEFQEFFTEDDKIAQDAALLLDRLVRQGRAFGIHVLFGSQTLGGAFSLPRSTIGQMAVRIALQCSEADAHLILSEENSAARLLTRPGEAIYNDANGMIEGNSPFQVTWLSDERREHYITILRGMSEERNFNIPPMIVFEGNQPADLLGNVFIKRLMDAPAPTLAPRSPRVWLGDAIAIKDPTSLTFARQSGAHLLLIGQKEEAALAMAAAAMLALSAQQPPIDPQADGPARMYLLDGTPADGARAGWLARVVDLLPVPVRQVERRTMGKSFSEITAEIQRRQEANEGDAPPIFFFVHDLQRFRELRKSEDDFSFSRSKGDAPPAPDKLFGTILREGPALGVHVIAWTDTLANLQRTFDRSGIKEFEMRVLFQMSVNDSSQLIDSPAAGKLGANRALFYQEEQGRLEKFRPYGLPDDEQLDAFRKRFAARPAAPTAEAAPSG